MAKFDKLGKEYDSRVKAGRKFCGRSSKFVGKDDTVGLLNAILKKGDRICIEGNNQKQADFFAEKLLEVDKRKVRDLHLVQSSIVLPQHIEIFEKGIASKLDFAFSGPQSKELYRIVSEKKVKVGSIHTYLELYSRYFIDLTPKVSFIAAESCDGQGNLFTGFNTEDTPTICEATKFKRGIVAAQVNKKLKKIPRVDIPSDWVDFIIIPGKDFYIKPLFTRDPALITDTQILIAMMTLKGIYLKYGVKSLNHGIGFPTAAIELILPTYGKEIGIKGKYCTHWLLNPHPTLIPAIEEGFVETVYSFGGEPGMEKYVKNRSDIFWIGPGDEMRSNRCMSHCAGLYAIDLFTGATLQIDKFGNSSTAIKGMIAGFGGAPNLGSTPPGRKNISEALRNAGHSENGVFYGKKLVVQITPTVSEKKKIPVFVDKLDAVELSKQGYFSYPPVMIPGDQVTHIVTEKGIAYLHLCRDIKTRMKAVAAVAGNTSVGKKISPKEINTLRKAKIVQFTKDIGIDVKKANRSLLAAKSISDLVRISKGLYHPAE